MKSNNQTFWWKIKEKEILTILKSKAEGLTSQEAENRLRTGGTNIIGGQKPRSAIKILTSQLRNWLILMLLGASMVSFFLGAHIDGVVIIALVLLSVAFGFFQEYKAEKIISDL